MYVLVVQGLPRTDSVLERVGDIRSVLPFGVRVPLNAQTAKASARAAKSARYQFKEPEPIRSVFEQLTPLSASVVEYEKHNHQNKKRGLT